MYPRRQKLYEDYLARLAEVTKDDKEAQIRATSYVRRFGNALTNTKGQLDGLVKGGLAQDKERQEKELRALRGRRQGAQGEVRHRARRHPEGARQERGASRGRRGAATSCSSRS